MSYRYLSGPDRALTSRLADVQSSLRQVEQRVRWTGAHRMVEALGETVLPNLEYVTDLDLTDVISLTVGEGRWVLLATTTMTATQTGVDPFYNADYRPQARIKKPLGPLFPTGASVAESNTMFRFDWQASGAMAARSLPMTSAILEVTTSTTFTLQVGMAQPIRNPPEDWAAVCRVKMCRLQAVPL